VLCHMAEGLWQNSYPVRETSCRTRLGPIGSRVDGSRPPSRRRSAPCRDCGSQGEPPNWRPAATQARTGRHRLSPGKPGPAAKSWSGEGAAGLALAPDQLEQSPSADVDNLGRIGCWCRQLEIGSGEGRDHWPNPFAELLAEAAKGRITLRIARRQAKVRRCWHYKTDISAHVLTPRCMVRLCGAATHPLDAAPLAR